MTDTGRLRRQLARWTTGITVMTTAGRDRVPLGKCANSFHSVSLDPPIVGWCVDLGSTRYDEWLAAPGYVVHVLAEDQQHLVSRFARSGGDKFADLAYTSGPFGMPLLADCVLRIVCRTRETFAAGDHTYLLGDVLQVDERDHPPLLFHGGRPHRPADLAEALDPSRTSTPAADPAARTHCNASTR